MRINNKTDIKFGFEPAHLVAGEIAPHIVRHHQSIFDRDDNGSINIDWDTYMGGGLHGICMIATARHNENLVGYAVYQIGTNNRQKHIVEAFCEGFFVEPEYRGTLGSALLRHADVFLSRYGVQQTHYLIENDRIGRLLARQNYHCEFKLWSKKYE